MNALPAGDPRHWENQAKIHLDHCPHGRGEFTIWHKHYLKYFEDICGELIGDPDFALCYWDWTLNQGRIPDPFYTNSQLNYSAWSHSGPWTDPNGNQVNTVGRRSIPQGTGLQDWSGVFAFQRIQAILRETSFRRFYSRLERSPHNTAHVMIGGHMGSLMSPLDPLFWLHHCNVDRLWDEWSAAGNTSDSFIGRYTGMFVDRNGAPVSREKSDLSEHDYSYDTIPSAQAASFIARRFELVENLDPIELRNFALGSQPIAESLIAGIENPFFIETSGVKANLFSERMFRPTNMLGTQRNASESGRTIAVLKDVSISGDPTGLEVAVFVNCPYLAPETPFTDPHYAGAFSFFGGDHMGGHMHGDDDTINNDVFIDITSVLNRQLSEGRLRDDKIEIQLVPRSIVGLEREVSEVNIETSEISIIGV